jgi:hypothetical protein
MPITYSIDTSVVVFINREMPRDIHEGLWMALEDLITSRRAFLAREAYEELRRVGDACAPWAKSFDGFICDATNDEVTAVTAIARSHLDWVAGSVNHADPWVIAHAQVYKRTVVTQETLKGHGTVDKNLKIPNVCAELGVPCRNLNALARDERWRFS